MSTVIYEWSRKKSIGGFLIMLICLLAAISIVEFNLVSPENLSYFSDALDITILFALLLMSTSLYLGFKVGTRL